MPAPVWQTYPLRDVRSGPAQPSQPREARAAFGKIACAPAHKLGWNSAATYPKLTLATLLHDLPLRNNQLAACSSLEEAQCNGFSGEELSAFKMHPMRAAEFARQFHEIPADVDQILMQHQEQPDGTGFPQGLTHKYITPLSTVFIPSPHDFCLMA